MVSNSLRAMCASVAVALFLGGVAGLVVSPRAVYVVALFAAAALAMPAMFGGRKPTALDLPRIDEHLHRVRTAMMACFAAASLLYASILTWRRQGAYTLLQQLASLGVALWVVAFVLLFFVVYYRAQRRLAAERE
ncbi:MAG TPA: hypothetical protein VG106_05190 [Vicinamibacterales bacterium]|nr:hypothetical protein [Vicinamibacterales bacterium]